MSSEPNISSAKIAACPIVILDWWDAVCTGSAAWQHLDDVQEALDTGPSLVRTVGMLVADEPTHVALMDTVILDGDACGYVHVIPRGMIARMQRIHNHDASSL